MADIKVCRRKSDNLRRFDETAGCLGCLGRSQRRWASVHMDRARTRARATKRRDLEARAHSWHEMWRSLWVIADLVHHCVFVLNFPVFFSVHTLCATQNQTKSIIREILIQINLQIMILKGVKLCILGNLWNAARVMVARAWGNDGN